MDIHERVQQSEQSPGALLGRSIRKFGQNRRTVRRGGGGAILEFVQFADERENMLLHIFRLEAKASAEAAGEKSVGEQEPRGLPETGRGYNWQGVRPAAARQLPDGKDAGYAANGTLAFRAVAGLETKSAQVGSVGRPG